MRRLGFAVGVMSMAVGACGRIVTEPKTTVSGGALTPPGNMLIRFRTQGPLDFTNLRYVVVFNTGGSGQEPYASSLTSFSNYSFTLVFGGSTVAGAGYVLFQVVSTGTSAGFQTVNVPIQTQYVTSFIPNSSGTGNEFTFTFSRQLLLSVPNSQASPSPSPAASAAPSPSPGATATPAQGQSTFWALNFFSTDPAGNPIDAIANNGVQDVTFNYQVDTTAAFDRTVTKPLPAPVQVQNASAQVIAIEVINTP